MQEVSLCSNVSHAYLRDQHGLVLTILQHVLVGIVTDREDMGWSFILSLATIGKHNFFCVQRQPSVRVNSHTEQARICLQMKNTVYPCLSICFSWVRFESCLEFASAVSCYFVKETQTADLGGVTEV